MRVQVLRLLKTVPTGSQNTITLSLCSLSSKIPMTVVDFAQTPLTKSSSSLKSTTDPRTTSVTDIMICT